MPSHNSVMRKITFGDSATDKSFIIPGCLTCLNIDISRSKRARSLAEKEFMREIYNDNEKKELKILR